MTPASRAAVKGIFAPSRHRPCRRGRLPGQSSTAGTRNPRRSAWGRWPAPSREAGPRRAHRRGRRCEPRPRAPGVRRAVVSGSWSWATIIDDRVELAGERRQLVGTEPEPGQQGDLRHVVDRQRHENVLRPPDEVEVCRGSGRGPRRTVCQIDRSFKVRGRRSQQATLREASPHAGPFDAWPGQPL